MTTDHLFSRYYYSTPDFVDGTTRFHSLCARYIPRAGAILEIGPGPSNPTSEYLRSFGAVTGVDVSAEAATNSALTSAIVYNGRQFPFDGNSFHACVSNYVLEHVEDPALHFREVARILKPGGVYCFRTPNLWHYVTLASKLTPHRFHTLLANRLRKLCEAHDPYPTFYRANTRRTLARLCRAAGLLPASISTIEAEPSYGRCHPLCFFPMMLYERLVNRTRTLQCLRMNIFAVMTKTA